jgi:hypothetical protein
MTRNTGRGVRARFLAAAIGTLSVASVLTGVGLVSANASPATPAWSGTEFFRLMTTQPRAARYRVIADGIFTAGGVDISGATTDLIVLPHGTFKVHHGGKVHVVSQHFNPGTCLGSYTVRAGFSIGNGTGRYKGIRGAGTATISSLFIARRTNGKCNPNATPAVNEQTIIARAKIRL